ncbi:MAG: hypothetical protein Q8K59_02525 [Nitrosomonas sp.]|nr:hypothetical protein [Nitrosomonas sp.]MDP1949967.1 hypothetical protein [Nitrosomonas sp.]
MTKRGKQASRKAAARKYGFLEVPNSHSIVNFTSPSSSNRACAINAHGFPMFFTPGHAHLHDLRLLAQRRMSHLCSIIERVTACPALV